MVRSVGTALTVVWIIASAWALIFWYWPAPTSESTSFSRLSSSSTCQSCTIDQTRKALARRSCSVGGALSAMPRCCSHHSLAAFQLASLVSSVPSWRQETEYHLPLYALRQRRLTGTHV